MRLMQTDRTSGFRLLLMTVTAALLSTTSPAQEPAPVPPGEPPAQASVGSLTARYRLQERFTTKDVSRDEKAAEGLIGQYQVGIRETIAVEDSGKEPRVNQFIYTERPAAISPLEDRTVTDLVRHYSSVKTTPDPWAGRKDQRPLDDLTIWYRRGSADTLPR